MDDIKTVSALEKACFSDAWSEASVTSQINSDNTVYLIKRDGEAAIGYALGTVVCGDAELYRIAVLPEYRRRGTGKELLFGFIDKCRSAGAEKMFLEVRSENVPAVSLYEKAGFKRISIRRGYYGDDDGVIMELCLRY